jgi:hypothetical protein
MNEDTVLGAALGAIFGIWFMVFVDLALGSSYVSEYPGLSDRLEAEHDECEADPGVIECTWDEDEATYTPKERRND